MICCQVRGQMLRGVGLMGLCIALTGCRDNRSEPMLSTNETSAASAISTRIAVAEIQVGQVNLKERLDAIALSIQQQVNEIVDAESAAATLPAFDDSLQKLLELRRLYDRLPDRSRRAFASLVARQTVLIRGQLEVTQENIVGAGRLVGPAFGRILQALESFR